MSSFTYRISGGVKGKKAKRAQSLEDSRNPEAPEPAQILCDILASDGRDMGIVCYANGIGDRSELG